MACGNGIVNSGFDEVSNGNFKFLEKKKPWKGGSTCVFSHSPLAVDIMIIVNEVRKSLPRLCSPIRMR